MSAHAHTFPIAADPLAGDVAWTKGDRVLLPNGVESEVCGVDFDDQQIMDECGGWHDMFDCDRLSS
jgi:hypothetical protein